MCGMRTGKRQFDLPLFLQWIAAIAFVVALLTGSGGSGAWTYDFAALPVDDTSLIQWLDSRGHRYVRVSRLGNSISLWMPTGVWRSTDDAIQRLPSPPWQQLGYPAPGVMRRSSTVAIISGSPYLWLMGFAILIGLGFWRSRLTARRMTNKENRGESPKQPHR